MEITPPALKDIGYKTYIIFAIFNLIAAGIVYCFYPETAYLNLEAVDLLFVPDPDRDNEINEKKTFYHRLLQSHVVPRARMAVNETKAELRITLSEREHTEGGATGHLPPSTQASDGIASHKSRDSEKVTVWHDDIGGE